MTFFDVYVAVYNMKVWVALCAIWNFICYVKLESCEQSYKICQINFLDSPFIIFNLVCLRPSKIYNGSSLCKFTNQKDAYTWVTINH